MRDLRRRLERLEAAELGDPYLIRKIRLHWGNDHEQPSETA
jgi:hypothetical protein